MATFEATRALSVHLNCATHKAIDAKSEMRNRLPELNQFDASLSLGANSSGESLGIKWLRWTIYARFMRIISQDDLRRRYKNKVLNYIQARK